MQEHPTHKTGQAKTQAAGYAGDIEAQEAWDMLASNPAALLVDVRSAAEWQFVGIPDLGPVGKEPVMIEWQIYPGMVPNDRFVNTLKSMLVERKANPDTPLLFLCRSGARSRAAAIALTREGFRACYNIAGGFEGDLDQSRHRGRINGWKRAGLPWIQT